MSTYSAEGVAGSHAGTGLGTRGEAVAVRLRPWARTDPASEVLHPGHSIRLRWLTPESENGAHVERVPARTCPQPHASGEHPHHAFDGHSGVFIIIPWLIVGLVLADLVLRSVEIGLFDLARTDESLTEVERVLIERKGLSAANAAVFGAQV
jgi:hypothetical protein